MPTDIIGYGGYDLIGQRNAWMAQQQAAMARRPGGMRRPGRVAYMQDYMAAGCPPPDAQVVQVQERPYTRANKFPLGFGSTTVAAGASATIRVQPQEPFKGKRLVVPSSIGANFTIDDIRVGNRSQLVVSGALPALTFSEQGWGVEVNLDTAQVSQFIELDVTNISGASQVFRGSLIGATIS